MMKKSQTIVFFGSGPVAAESLRLLLQNDQFIVEAVVTKPTPAHHKGIAPVIALCESADIAYQTPANKTELTTFFASRPFSSNMGIVIDYGIIIEQAVIDYFQLGIINSHFSLLPQWRGADPITFSILSGQTETGVSLMRITAGMDEGPLLAFEKLRIEPSDTSEVLTEKLINLSNVMLGRYLPLYADGSLQINEQSGQPTYSRKLVKADGIIDWHKPAEVIEREIRGYHEWPKSRGHVGQHDLIIRQATVTNETRAPGSFVANKKELTVYCGTGALRIERVQPAGKKEMPIQAFLLGYKL